MNVTKSLRREQQSKKRTKFRQYDPSEKKVKKKRDRKKGYIVKEQFLQELLNPEA